MRLLYSTQNTTMIDKMSLVQTQCLSLSLPEHPSVPPILANHKCSDEPYNN